MTRSKPDSDGKSYSHFRHIEGPLANFTVSTTGGVQKNPHSLNHVSVGLMPTISLTYDLYCGPMLISIHYLFFFQILLVGKKDGVSQTCISKDAGDSFKCNPLVINGDSCEPAGTFIFTEDRIMTILVSAVSFHCCIMFY